MQKRGIVIVAAVVAIAVIGAGAWAWWSRAYPCGRTAMELPPEDDRGNPVVTLCMSSGNVIRIELYPDVAPNTVNNFVHLVAAGFYDGLIFHRIVPGFVIQGGDPNNDGTGGPSYAIRGEFALNGHPNPLRHERGVVSMARSSVSYDSAGSQFFIVLGNASHLDGGYAAFGRVIEGMDEVERIAALPTNAAEHPLHPDEARIVKATVETFGIEYPEPQRLPRLF